MGAERVRSLELQFVEGEKVDAEVYIKCLEEQMVYYQEQMEGLEEELLYKEKEILELNRWKFQMENPDLDKYYGVWGY